MRLGAKAKARRAAGGPAVKGRPALSVSGYAALRTMLFVRANNRCECCSARLRLQIEHAVPRSAGGADSWANCWVTCERCHRMKEAPYSAATGRLLVAPQGDGRFKFRIVKGTKSAHQVLEVRWGGRGPTYTETEYLNKLA